MNSNPADYFRTAPGLLAHFFTRARFRPLMAQNGQKNTGLGAAYARAALGMQFAGGVMVFTGVGYALDRWLGILPWLTVAGALIGATLSFLNVFFRIRAEDEARKQARK